MSKTGAWSYHMVDPQEIETRFSNEDGMAYMDSLMEESSEESQLLLDRVREMLENLPPREADFIDLYYFCKFKQTDIANLFGVSQPTVCYRLQRATARIQFLLELPRISDEEMEDSLSSVISSALDIQIMLLMYKTTCQSAVAKQLDVSQGLVRHRFLRSIERLRKSSEHETYLRIFESIASNLTILREVQRPSSMDRVHHTIL